MQAADLWDRNDLALVGWFDPALVGRVSIQGQVRAAIMIITEVRLKDSSQMPFVEDDDVVEALATDGTNESFRESILPRTVGSGENFLNAVWSKN